MRLFITGGSRGIGRAIVEAGLAAGHDVAFTYRVREDAADQVLAWARERHPDRRCLAFPLDVGDAEAVERVGETALEELGGVEAAICNAGAVQNQLAVQMADADWDEVIRTNLTGSFYVARHFLMPFLAAGRGRLVFLGSVAQHGLTGQVAYAASKAGLLGLARTLAKEYGHKGITSNVVVPGFFETDMTREAMASTHQAFWLEHCPMHRMGKLDELAQVVLFLVSDAASFVNGQAVSVTGGLDWAV